MISISNLVSVLTTQNTWCSRLQIAAHRLLSSTCQPSELTVLVAEIVQEFGDSTILYL